MEQKLSAILNAYRVKKRDDKEVNIYNWIIM